MSATSEQKAPDHVGTPLDLTLYGLTFDRQGKVRDTYKVKGRSDRLVVRATDRISTFDFILRSSIPGKGTCLTVLTHFSSRHILRELKTDLADDISLNDLPLEVRQQCLPVINLVMLERELIVRFGIGGSAWDKEKNRPEVPGYTFPPDLRKWENVNDGPIFTPSTKAKEGHDVNISPQDYLRETGKRGEDAMLLCLEASRLGSRHYASRGYHLYDTKFEAGWEPDAAASPNGAVEIIIGDERLTPDSSRTSTEREYEASLAEGRDPRFSDKQFVRDYVDTVLTPFFDKNGAPIVGLKKLDPRNATHQAFARSIELPDEVVAETAANYHKLTADIIGGEIRHYLREEIGVR